MSLWLTLENLSILPSFNAKFEGYSSFCIDICWKLYLKLDDPIHIIMRLRRRWVILIMSKLPLEVGEVSPHRIYHLFRENIIEKCHYITVTVVICTKNMFRNVEVFIINLVNVVRQRKRFLGVFCSSLFSCLLKEEKMRKRQAKTLRQKDRKKKHN